MSLFGGGNPFATQVGHLVEKSTDGSLASEDWGQYMEVCDMLNSTDDGPKDCQKAIRKRLTQNAGKNHTIVLYTLTLLETCVKNCGKRFHMLIAHKDFLKDMVAIIGPKNDPPIVVQEKVLSLIQTWADAFQGQPDLKEVGKTYQDLKSKGIEFPPTNLDQMAPIHTPTPTGLLAGSPQRQSVTGTPQGRANPQQMQHYPVAPQHQPHPHQPHQPHPQQPQQPLPPQQHPPQQQVQFAVGPVTLTPEQMAKMRSELDIVQQNCKVFGDMLTEITPGQENPGDYELLQDLNRTVRQMQKRIQELIERVQNEEVTGELLRINDELNNVFLRYERYERLRSSGQVRSAAGPAEPGTLPAPVPSQPQMASPFPPVGATTTPSQIPAPPGNSGDTAVGNLIDLDLPPPNYSSLEGSTASPAPPPVAAAPAANANDIHLRLAGMNLGASTVSGTLSQINTTPASTRGAPTDDDFDMFAQSRQSFEQNKGVTGTETYANQSQDLFGSNLSQAAAAKSQPVTEPKVENLENEKRSMSGEELEAQLIDKETDYDEMEKWLKENPRGDSAQQPSATSSEFDRFLADRATAPDGTTDGGQKSLPRGGRQMQNDDTENAMFAL